MRSSYLDRQGLTACWREALLAQAVLTGRTRGYRNHSQLVRFQACARPMAAIGEYLWEIADEAAGRSYRFDRTLILEPPTAERAPRIPVTDGQVAYEWGHLMAKLRLRSPRLAATWETVAVPELHPLFISVPGPVEPWERT